jgi:hypothetical protein
VLELRSSIDCLGVEVSPCDADCVDCCDTVLSSFGAAFTVRDGTAGSGSEGIDSSAEDVSMVILVVARVPSLGL